MKVFLTTLVLLPLLIMGQHGSTPQSIDSIITVIENDSKITKKVFDTVSYQKEDGGTHWDSLYSHRDFFYKDGKIVKIQAWKKYGKWRHDILAFYQDGKAIRFSKGEGFEGRPGYGELEFQIYYFEDKDIQVTWLRPKPANVLIVATDTFLEWAYSLLENK